MRLTLSLLERSTRNALFFLRVAKSGQTDPDDFSNSALFFPVSFIVHSMYLKSTEHTLYIYHFDFVLRSE